MPNWCDNALIGPEEVLKKYVNKEGYFDFMLIKPRPASEDANWYNWNSENWGTKWNVSEATVHPTKDGKAVVNMMTAWSPPEAILKALIELHPDVDFELHFDEPGMCFRGSLIVEGDTVYETDLSWHYEVDGPEECPECGAEYMYTSSGDYDKVIKRCEECGHEVLLNSDGKVIKKGPEDTLYQELDQEVSFF